MAEEEKTEKTVEYADFSDMMGTELPDEIDETPEDTQLSVDYLEDTQEETVEAEAQPETSPEPEEKPDSYWQSQHDLLRNQAEQDKNALRQEIDSLKTQLPPPPKEEPLVAPIPPTTDDPNDMLVYLKDKSDFDSKVLDKRFETQEKYFQTLEAERQQRVQADQANAQKTYVLGKLQTAGGLTPEESIKALEFSASASTDEDGYYKKLGDFFKHSQGQSTKPIPTSKKETSAPLAIETGEAQTQKVEEGDEFFGDMQGYIQKNY